MHSPNNPEPIEVESSSAEKRRMSDSLPTPDRLHMDPTLQLKSPDTRFGPRKPSETEN